jgi:hypothetical protein
MGTDLLGPLPVTPRGNKYILTITDYFTKWVEIVAVPDQTAVTCAQIRLNEVVIPFHCLIISNGRVTSLLSIIRLGVKPVDSFGLDL